MHPRAQRGLQYLVCVCPSVCYPYSAIPAAKEQYQRPQCYVDIVLNGAFFLKLFCCKDRGFFAYTGEVGHFCLLTYNYTRAYTFYSQSLRVRVYMLRVLIYSCGRLASMCVMPHSCLALVGETASVWVSSLPRYLYYCSVAIHYSLTGHSITTHAHARWSAAFICEHLGTQTICTEGLHFSAFHSHGTLCCSRARVTVADRERADIIDTNSRMATIPSVLWAVFVVAVFPVSEIGV